MASGPRVPVSDRRRPDPRHRPLLLHLAGAGPRPGGVGDGGGWPGARRPYGDVGPEAGHRLRGDRAHHRERAAAARLRRVVGVPVLVRLGSEPHGHPGVPGRGRHRRRARPEYVRRRRDHPCRWRADRHRDRRRCRQRPRHRRGRARPGPGGGPAAAAGGQPGLPRARHHAGGREVHRQRRDRDRDLCSARGRAAARGLEPDHGERMTLSLPSPRLIAPQSVPVLRWGVIGTSIGDSFVQAVHAHTPQRVVAVAARDRDRHRSHGSRPFPRRSPIPSGLLPGRPLRTGRGVGRRRPHRCPASRPHPRLGASAGGTAVA
ncbi:protein of unknown function [Micropruina glycogenica]|uniref:Gfo/Idh/MocA-like oxidoreductase N-terminal domain-containing protein n=1 Tax=Micropruina glycogenica TaxID=75385 RepID=A0A2N9JFU3_9ACTN|nr:protein of unknown function [Micropruina glycogenica]